MRKSRSNRLGRLPHSLAGCPRMVAAPLNGPVAAVSFRGAAAIRNSAEVRRLGARSRPPEFILPFRYSLSQNRVVPRLRRDLTQSRSLVVAQDDVPERPSGRFAQRQEATGGGVESGDLRRILDSA